MQKKRLLTMLGLAALGGLAYGWLIEPRLLRVHSQPVTLPRLPAAFHHYRVVQISDLHMGTSMTRQRLLEVVRCINLIHPDLIVITGDFVGHHSGPLYDDLVAGLSQLQAPDGVLAVMGNHDYRHGVNGVRRALEASGVIEIRNSVHSLHRGEAALYIAGVDTTVRKQDCLDAVLDQLPQDAAAVLLAHEPDFADLSAPTGRFDLQLSGHTHGGQVRLPLVGPPVLPSHGVRYAAGLYRVADMLLYTNSGLGMVSPYVRIGVRPEITVLTLQAASA